jgi:hypothetical protein
MASKYFLYFFTLFSTPALAAYSLSASLSTGRHTPLDVRLQLASGQSGTIESNELILKLQAEDYGKNRVLISGELKEKGTGKAKLLARPMLITTLGERSEIQVLDPQNDPRSHGL